VSTKWSVVARGRVDKVASCWADKVVGGECCGLAGVGDVFLCACNEVRVVAGACMCRLWSCEGNVVVNK
jgi:hypothetical protein